MNIQKPVITSDAMASVSQMIAAPALYESGWLYLFYERLNYDREKKHFVFPDERLLWEYGIHRKRYVEYPWTENTKAEMVCGYLNRCLERQNYLIHYVDEFVWEGIRCKPYLLIYDIRMEGKGAAICCFGLDDRLYYAEAEWTRIYETVLLPAAEKKRLFCFDLERTEHREEYVFDRRLLKVRLKKATFSVIRCKNWLLHMNVRQREHSAKVFCEWFAWFARRLDYLKERQELVGEYDSMHRLCVEAEQALADRQDRKELIRAVKNYNELCRCLGTVLAQNVREKEANEKSIKKS